MKSRKSAKRKPQRRGRRNASAEHRGGSLLHRNDEKSEQEVQEHLRMAAHPHVASAVRVVEMSVDALDSRTVAKAHFFRRDDAHESFASAVGLRLSAPRVRVDDGDMAVRLREVANLTCVVGRVLQVVQRERDRVGLLHERYRRLGVVDARGSEARGYRDVAVGDGDVELVAAPELRLALAVALASPVAERWKKGHVCVEVSVFLKSERVVVFRVRVDLRLDRGGFRGIGFFVLRRRAFPGVDFGGVDAAVDHDAVFEYLPGEPREKVVGHLVDGKVGERPRHRRFRRNVRLGLPSAKSAQRRRPAHFAERILCLRPVPDVLHEKEFEDGKAARRLSSVAAPSVPCRNLPQFKRLRNADKQLLLLVEFPDLVFDEVEERWLYRQPMVGKSFAHAIFGLVFHACIISYILQKCNGNRKIIAITTPPRKCQKPPCGMSAENDIIPTLDSSVVEVCQRVSASQAACPVSLAKEGFCNYLKLNN